ncbi:Protein argonaute 9 [Camellia lanceoleosa]|uniref:Protein argonaute 9 n=1 Tax=Camellia lanceoleosa TaxID=1840588 RepID=A0ACC0HAD2_9ERIC|nr:Protein argonaute 9 [Camellia lanceoleosa]
MFEDIQTKLPRAPQFLLCLLPEWKNSDLYGPWKRKNLADFAIVTQCIASTKVNDQYLTNVLLKINAKVRWGLLCWLMELIGVVLSADFGAEGLGMQYGLLSVVVLQYGLWIEVQVWVVIQSGLLFEVQVNSKVEVSSKVLVGVGLLGVDVLCCSEGLLCFEPRAVWRSVCVC